MGKKWTQRAVIGDQLRPNQRPGGFCVHLSPVNYRCCWLLIFALHAFCAAYYVVVAALYQYLQSTAVIWTVELYSLSIEVTAFAFITALNALFAAGHLWGVIKIVWHSVRDRQLTFSSTAHGQNQHPKADDRTSSSLGQNIWRTVSGRGGMLGIETEYYDLRLVMYETIEIVLQSCQCYRMSWFLSRMWLQHLHMGLIVVNCWIGALVHLLNRRHHTNHENAARTRVKLVLIDMLLDIVSTIVIPCVLFKTYYDQYDAVSTDFPLSFYYNDLSLMSFLNEFQFLLVNNKYDLVMRCMFAAGLLVSMESIKVTLQRTVGPTTIVPTSAPTLSTLQRTAPTRPPPTRSPHPNTSSNCTGPTLPQKRRTRVSVVVNALHFIFVLWGCVVLFAQLHAQAIGESTNCIVAVHPWFRNKAGCALIELNGTHRSEDDDTKEAVADELAM